MKGANQDMPDREPLIWPDGAMFAASLLSRPADEDKPRAARSVPDGAPTEPASAASAQPAAPPRGSLVLRRAVPERCRPGGGSALHLDGSRRWPVPAAAPPGGAVRADQFALRPRL